MRSKTRDELRKTRWGPASEYDQRIRSALKVTPFDAIDWDALPLEDVREILRVLGVKIEAGRYRLVRAARKAVWAHQRGGDLVKIAPAPR